MHACVCTCTRIFKSVCVCVCVDYSDEIAAGVYEQIQTQLLIEEVVRGSCCKSMLNLQL